MPSDFISIIFGDPEYPYKDKIDYISRRIFNGFYENVENKKILVVTGSHFMDSILKNIFLLY